jgi:hypothetical protein
VQSSAHKLFIPSTPLEAVEKRSWYVRATFKSKWQDRNDDATKLTWRVQGKGRSPGAFARAPALPAFVGAGEGDHFIMLRRSASGSPSPVWRDGVHVLQTVFTCENCRGTLIAVSNVGKSSTPPRTRSAYATTRKLVVHGHNDALTARVTSCRICQSGCSCDAFAHHQMVQRIQIPRDAQHPLPFLSTSYARLR